MNESLRKLRSLIDDSRTVSQKFDAAIEKRKHLENKKNVYLKEYIKIKEKYGG